MRIRLPGRSARSAAVGLLLAAFPGGVARSGEPPTAPPPTPSAPPVAAPAEPGPRPAAEAVTEALRRLRSRFLAEREQAVAELTRLLPGSRDAVLAEFRTADGATKPLLVRVLAADGTQPSLDALLLALSETKDAETASAIQLSLVDHAETIGDAVLAWRDAAGTTPPRIAELGPLLRRARVEALFLSRKSKSGGTGSYPGQFEVLRPERQMALDVCLAILADRAVLFKVPGTFPAGAYRFLRPLPFFVDRLELRHMAVNAIAELATEKDEAVIDRLESYYHDLEREIEDRRAITRVSNANVLVLNLLRVEGGVLDAVLATLARLRPDPWRPLAEARVEELERDYLTEDDAAAMALRLGDYRTAEALYLNLRQSGERAIASYNLACAYARWSQEVAKGTDRGSPTRGRDRRPTPSAETLRLKALFALESSVAAGYPDWAWMEQDRDLDAIKDDPRFSALVERMKAAFRLPGQVDEPPKAGPTDPK